MSDPANPYEAPPSNLPGAPSGGGDRSTIGGAVFFTLVAHALYAVVAGALAYAIFTSGTDPYRSLTALVPAFFIGLGQLLYMVPAFFVARAKGRFAFAKGVAICAGATGLANAACFGLLAGG